MVLLVVYFVVFCVLLVYSFIVNNSFTLGIICLVTRWSSENIFRFLCVSENRMQHSHLLCLDLQLHAFSFQVTKISVRYFFVRRARDQHV